MRVIARVRPLLPHESAHEDLEPAIILGDDGQSIYINGDLSASHSSYNNSKRVYDETTTQQEVYNECMPSLIDGAFKGESATVIAYGQVGTGKRFTIEGNPENPGLLPYTIHNVFKAIAESYTPNLYEVRISWYEIYNENVQDLFAANNTHLRIKDDIKKGIVLDGLIEIRVDSPEEAFQLINNVQLDYGRKSHTIFSVIVGHKHKIMKQIKGTSGAQRRTPSSQVIAQDITASLKFVVTADFEQGDHNAQATAGRHTVAALHTLRRVIELLDKKVPHIPFHKSKLTLLLKDSLVGNVSTTFIATISPARASLPDTLNTLRLAAAALNINNKVDTPPKQSHITPLPSRPGSPTPPSPPPHVVHQQAVHNGIDEDADLEELQRQVASPTPPPNQDTRASFLERERDSLIAERNLLASEVEQLRQWVSNFANEFEGAHHTASGRKSPTRGRTTSPPPSNKHHRDDPPLLPSQLEGEVKKLRTQLQRAQQEINGYKIYKDVIDKNIVHLREELLKVETTKDILEKKVKAKDTHLKKNHKEYELLTKSLKESIVAVENLEADKKELRNRVAELERLDHERVKWVESTRKEVEELRKGRTQWEYEVSSDVASLSAENKRLQDANKLLQRELDERAKEVSVLTDEVVRLTKATENEASHIEEIEKLRSRVIDLELELKKKDVELKTSVADITDKDKMSARSLRTAQIINEATIAQLRKQIADLQMELQLSKTSIAALNRSFAARDSDSNRSRSPSPQPVSSPLSTPPPRMSSSYLDTPLNTSTIDTSFIKRSPAFAQQTRAPSPPEKDTQPTTTTITRLFPSFEKLNTTSEDLDTSTSSNKADDALNTSLTNNYMTTSDLLPLHMRIATRSKLPSQPSPQTATATTSASNTIPNYIPKISSYSTTTTLPSSIPTIPTYNIPTINTPTTIPSFTSTPAPFPSTTTNQPPPIPHSQPSATSEHTTTALLQSIPKPQQITQPQNLSTNNTTQFSTSASSTTTPQSPPDIQARMARLHLLLKQTNNYINS